MIFFHIYVKEQSVPNRKKFLENTRGLLLNFKFSFLLFLFFADIPASGLYFLTYEYVKELAAKEIGTEGSRALIGTIFAGGSAGVANWIVGMPADVLKSRLQTGNTQISILQINL